MKPGTAVWYVGEHGKQLAFVTADHGSAVNLLTFNADGAGTTHTSVPKRSPADYGPEGGGHTWHEIEG
jgi:hypothetical protein